MGITFAFCRTAKRGPRVRQVTAAIKSRLRRFTKIHRKESIGNKWNVIQKPHGTIAIFTVYFQPQQSHIIDENTAKRQHSLRRY